MIKGLECRAKGLGFRAEGLWCRAKDLGFRVWGR